MEKRARPKRYPAFFARPFLFMLFWTSRRVRLCGILVGALANRKDRERIQCRVAAALKLIERYDPRRFRYLRRDVARILVFGAPSYRGCWHEECKMCELTDSYVLDGQTTPAMIAATLAHEAMHARLRRWGIGNEEVRRVRVERICFKVSLAFAKRLPDSERASRERIIADVQAQIARDPAFWTNEKMIEAKLDAIRDLGCPKPILAFISWSWKRKLKKAAD